MLAGLLNCDPTPSKVQYVQPLAQAQVGRLQALPAKPFGDLSKAQQDELFDVLVQGAESFDEIKYLQARCNLKIMNPNRAICEPKKAKCDSKAAERKAKPRDVKKVQNILKSKKDYINKFFKTWAITPQELPVLFFAANHVNDFWNRQPCHFNNVDQEFADIDKAIDAEVPGRSRVLKFASMQFSNLFIEDTVD